MANPLYTNRLHLSNQAFVDETAHVKFLLGHTESFSALHIPVTERASRYAEVLREQRGKHASIEDFLQEYGLDTKEGITLMCLAEALLRIPDSATVNALIRDKFKETDWKQHLGHSHSLLVNASSWGMLFTGSLVHLGEAESGIKSLFKKLGEPVIRTALKKAMQMIGSQFIIGETIEEGLRHSKAYEKQGYVFSYDMLGEGARTFTQAEDFFNSYHHAIQALGKATKKAAPLFDKPSISIKLSALHPRYELIQSKRLLEEMLPKLESLVSQAAEYNIAVTIDAEESARLDVSLLLFEELLNRPRLKGFDGIGLAVQAYQKRAWYVLEYLQNLAEHHHKRIPIRLVKGAYWDTEIKLAQQLGLPGYPVFTQKHHTDVSYLACAKALFDNPKAFYPQFATHNAHTVSAILESAGKREFEFQRLHGMGETLHNMVLEENKGVKCRIYAPVGKHKELLPYLIRRMLENGSSTSFIHQVGDDTVPIRTLIEDPISHTKHHKAGVNKAIALPEGIYQHAKETVIPAQAGIHIPEAVKGSNMVDMSVVMDSRLRGNDGGILRKNSTGFDLGNLQHLSQLETMLQAYQSKTWSAAPIVAGKTLGGENTVTYRPFDVATPVGNVVLANEQHIEQALVSASKAFLDWNKTSADTRAVLLEKAADLIEQHRDEAIALCVFEAGKILADAIAEVREAADFCRYYAALIRTQFHEHSLQGPTGEYNALSLHGRGTFLCVSPWNFPLAIFTGQITAALAAGNCVIAKPAGQTPLVASFVVKLMHEAGIPTNVLHYMPASGRLAGEKLVTDPRIKGIAFTGSTATARTISQALAAREGEMIPFIAETGGQNTMIVDSTALLEAAVDDIILSAFNSAGQRCSALRVLYVQDDIADPLITLLKGAMEALTVGDPSHVFTHIGPVIDNAAKDKLSAHIRKMQEIGKLIAKSGVMPAQAGIQEKSLLDSSFRWNDNNVEKGHFIAPHAFEIDSIDQLKEEVFGPVLHIIRFASHELDKVVEEINSTGYGLTFGVHSRVEEKIQYLRKHIHAGNMYVNRNMIGAVVGVQPFGGEGLSGTGPKAGGPHYLLRFAHERTFTNNIAAIGGNIALLV